MSTQRRTVRVAAGAALVAGVLGACAGPIPEPQAEPPASEPAPVLDEARVERILDEVREAVDEADAAMDPELLEGRLEGPALEMRTAEYELSEASEEDRVPSALATSSQVQVVSATEEWPRSMFVVSQVPDGENLPLLLVLSQQTARSQYQLFSWTPLLPGASTPSMPNTETGADPIDADADSLALSPQDVLEEYGDLLAGGKDEAETFAADPFREQYREAVDQLASTVEVAGELTQEFTVVEDSLVSMATAEEGGLVTGVLHGSLTLRRTVDGSTLRAAGDIGTLLGEDKKVEDEVVADFLFPVAFHVPAADSEEQVDVVGAQQVITGVTQE